MISSYNSKYPSVADLQRLAKKRIPRFAYEYLEGGCNENINRDKNNLALQKIELKPFYLRKFTAANLSTELFGHKYSAPFGIAPVGLQGLFWPKTPEILARAANLHNIPFVLSTVTTTSIEKIGEITQGNFWFQLYHPLKAEVRDDLLERAMNAGCKVLVLVCDVPTYAYRPHDTKNGMAMPPNITCKNIFQAAIHPHWSIKTLINGIPKFANVEKYLPKNQDLVQLSSLMSQTFSGRLDEERIKPIRKKWQGQIILKGVSNIEDVQLAIDLGLDAVVVSNHGGRQLDAAEAAIYSLQKIVGEFRHKIKIMMDSGIYSGVDIARSIACGAEFVLLGRAFNYATAALGEEGGNHVATILKCQLQQIMEQIGCENINNLPQHLI